MPPGIASVQRLRITDAAVGYQALRVLEGVELVVGPGELVGLHGRNGSGKSTLMRAIVGLAQFHSGRLKIDGKRVRRPALETVARRHGVGFLPQENRGIESLSVEENLELAAWGGGRRRDRRHAVAHLLEDKLFSSLVAQRSAPVGDLSGGQRLRVALGMMQLLGPRLLLLDEPTSGADTEAQNSLGTFLERHAYRGAGILLVEQEIEILRSNCDKVYCVSRGTVVLDRESAEPCP